MSLDPNKREYMLPSFGGQVAEIQARHCGHNSEKRRKELIDFFRTIHKRAKAGKGLVLGKKSLAGLADPGANEATRTAIYVALTKQLADCHTWTAKIQSLLTVARVSQPPWCDEILDMFISDVMDSKTGIHEVIGLKRDLGDADEAVKVVLAQLDGVRPKLSYLLHLSATSFGQRNINVVARHVATISTSLVEIYDVTYFRLPLRQKIGRGFRALPSCSRPTVTQRG